MIQNIIGSKGFITKKTTGSYSTEIEDFASLPKYQLLNSAPLTISGSSIHDVLLFNTSTLDGGLDVWNIEQNLFFPRRAGEFYTLRLDGVVPLTGVSNSPVIHIDLEISGVIDIGVASPHDEVSLNRQTIDLSVRTQGDLPEHQHFHGIYIVLATEDMVVSGATFYAASSGPQVQFLSGTLLIKEG